MADADLDVVIRQTAKQQNKTLMAAVKARRDRYAAMAAKARDKSGKDRFKQLAKDAVEQGTAAARRLQMSADNAADSYARAMRRAVELLDAKPDSAPEKKAAATKAPKEKTPKANASAGKKAPAPAKKRARKNV